MIMFNIYINMTSQKQNVKISESKRSIKKVYYNKFKLNFLTKMQNIWKRKRMKFSKI